MALEEIDITASGTISGTTLCGDTIFSGDTELSTIFRNNTPNIVTVGLSGNVNFTSIKSAIDSITAHTFDNQYVVQVGPGLFVEDTLVMKPYVSVKGSGRLTTTIEVDSPAKNAIIGARTSSINDCTIQGATGSGNSAIFYSNNFTVFGEPHPFLIEGCSFGANNILVHISGTTSALTSIVASGIIKGTNSGDFVQGFVSENVLSGLTATISLKNSQIISSTATTEAFLVYGPLAQLIVDSTSISRLGNIAQTAVKIISGGTARLYSVDIRNHSKGIWMASGGTATSISAVGINMSLNTQDVFIEDSAATGSIQGVFNRIISFINPSSTVVLQGLDRRIVRVAKLDTDYESIKSAVDSIVDASDINRYIVSIGPGIFNEDKITLKPYISLIGNGADATFIQANNPNDDLIISTGNSRVQDLKVGGTTGSTKSCFVHTGDLYGGVFTVVNCAFTNTDKILTQTSTSGPSIAFFSECTFDALSKFTTGFDVSDNGVNFCLNGITSFSWLANPSIATNFQDVVKVSGTLTKSISSNLYIGADLGSISGNCFHISNGATFNMAAAQLHGFNRAVYVENTGTGPSIIINSLQLLNNNTDLFVDHPGTTGSFQGTADMEKIIINSASTLNIVIQDDVDGELNISNKLNIRFPNSTLTDVSTAIVESSTMGVMEGGELTAGTGFTVNIGDGFGYLEEFPDNDVLRKLTWSNTTITLSANTENYIFFNYNEILTTSSSRPDTFYNILLGRAVTNSTGITFIDHSPLAAEHTSNRLSVFTRDALGPIYVSGSIVTENTGSTFHLNVTQGNYYFAENNFLPTGATSTPMTVYWQNGSGGFSSSATTIIDHSHYDNISGILAPLSAGFYTKHSLYLIDDDYFLVYGSAQYSALTIVEQSDISTPPTYFSDSVVLIAGIIVQQGTSAITEIQDLRPVIGFKAPGVAASSFHGNLLGLGSDDHPQYLLVSGARAMTGNFNVGGNNIISAGTVNGVTVQSHSSRHLPNGADPLSSATAVSLSNVNTEGIANAFSRSDHTHAHAPQSGGTTHSLVDSTNAGYMSSADKIYFDTISNVFNTKANLSGATFTGQINSPAISATTVSGGTFLSGSTNLYSIFQQIGTNTQTAIQPGTNTYTGGTSLFPTVNVSALTINTLVASGSSQLGATTASSFSGGTVSGGTILSGSTDLRDIFLTKAQQTGIAAGSNITTGGTFSLPTISLIASPSINNLISSGSAQMNTETAVSISGGTVSGGTFISGSTNLYSVFQPIGAISANSNGTNTYTGGTFANTTINVSALTINTLIASGSSQLGTTTASSFSGGTVSGGTFISGGTDLYNIFHQKNGYLLQKAGTVTGSTFAGNPKTATVTFTTNFPNNNYAVSIVADISRSWSIQSKTLSGFTINANANQAFNSSNVYWTATEFGEGYR